MKPSTKALTTFPNLCFLVATLSACGGSGSTPKANVNSLNWQSGVFLDPDRLSNLCELPRSGTDINGDSFPDREGSALAEKLFLRSWSNDFYFWYDEIEDNNPNPFSVAAYFDQLKTNELTAQGSPKDNFHFTIPTEDYLQSTQSGVVSGYGMSLRLVRDSNNLLELVIIDVEQNSPASIAGLDRGSRITQVDDIVLAEIESSQFTELNNALFPDTNNSRHFFIANNPDSEEELSFFMNSSLVVEDPVKHVSTIEHNGSRIGYFLFNSFSNQIAELELYNAITELNTQNINELVIDLRYNGGGLLAISAQLGYMLSNPEENQGKTFEELIYNDKFPGINPFNGNAIEPFPFINTSLGFSLNSGTALPNVDLDRIFIITTDNTCSASESLINGLRGIDVEVVQIGSTTCGKPYGFNPVNNCGTTYFTINFTGINNKGFGEFPDGFSPANESDSTGVPVTGCVAIDDYDNAFGDPAEASLNTALYYIDNGNCPPTVESDLEFIATQNKAGSLTALTIDSPEKPLDKYDQLIEQFDFEIRQRNILRNNKMITE